MLSSGRKGGGVGLAVLMILTFLILFDTHSSHIDGIRIAVKQDVAAIQDPYLANATLGFQKILAVSSSSADPSDPSAWRRQGLIAAANRTGLDISIPPINAWSGEDVIKLLQKTTRKDYPSRGSGLAWLAHLDVLQKVVSANLSTALILEDDADWDVSIRETLAPYGPLATLLRNLSSSFSSEAEASRHPQDYSTPLSLPNPPPLASPNPTEEPFGHAFDVFWLGHCGIAATYKTHVASYEDAALLPNPLQKHLKGPGAATASPRTRRIYYGSQAPLCTFAYGVTREGAEKIIRLSLRRGKGAGAFDLFMMHACREGALRCAAVDAEVIHHQRIAGEDTSLVQAEGYFETYTSSSTQTPTPTPRATPSPSPSSQAQTESESESESVELKKVRDPGEKQFYTFNIRYSARCNAHRKDDELVQCLPPEDEWEARDN